MNSKIMLVDDEPKILDGYARSLRKQFDITTCCGGAEALKLNEQEGPFAVIVSDMRMPEMTGVELLSKIKTIEPDTVRIMLTGNADQKTAVDAVNEGDVFKFLTKPCSPLDMGVSLRAAIEQYRLIRAEKELLEHTVKGSIAALAEVLSLVRPGVYGRTNQYKEDMLAVAEKIGVEGDWKLETTAHFSLVGTTSLSDELVERALSGAQLSADDHASFINHPIAGYNVLAKIPRIEEVAESIRYQLKNFDGTGVPEDSVTGEDIPLGARMLRAIMQLDLYERSGMPTTEALATLESESGLFDPAITQALKEIRHERLEEEIVEISVEHARNGMTLADDIKTLTGTLLITRGQELTDAVRERLNNFVSNGQVSPIIAVKIGQTSE